MRKPYIINKILSYKLNKHHIWHMPGHKRKSLFPKKTKAAFLNDFFSYDFTEVTDLDDLHHPTSFINAAQVDASDFYKTYKTYFLVNGATSGILSGIFACCNTGDSILISRNSHKSVYNAVYLLKLKPYFIETKKIHNLSIYSSVDISDIENHLSNNNNIKAIVITSPTYEGIISDISSIKNLCIKYNCLLIVDEAHGAHLPFYNDFPDSALESKADIIVHGLHKTLPCLTQCGVLHLNNPSIAMGLEKYLKVFQSSSPSYIFLSSIDACIHMMRKYNSNTYFRDLSFFYKQLTDPVLGLKNLKLLFETSNGAYDFFLKDISKIVIITSFSNISGSSLQNLLETKYNIICEMSGLDYVVLISTFCDKKSDFSFLKKTLLEIDRTLLSDVYIEKSVSYGNSNKYSDNDLNFLHKKTCIQDIYTYPPGIPIISSGEAFSQEILNHLKLLIDSEKFIHGLSENISILKNGGNQLERTRDLLQGINEKSTKHWKS